MGIFIGIDPGIGGAIAVLDGPNARLVEVHDMPVVEDGPKGRKRVNAPLLYSLLQRHRAAAPSRRAVVERVGVRPGEGAVGAFSFGRSIGVAEGMLVALGVSVIWITPQEWKKRLHFPPKADKEFSRGRALEIWPARADLFARKKDDGRAEAALIAFAGSMGDF